MSRPLRWVDFRERHDTTRTAALLTIERGVPALALARARARAQYAIAMWTVLAPPEGRKVLPDRGIWVPQPLTHCRQRHRSLVSPEDSRPTSEEGRGQTLWPRPGRVFAAARSHTFLQLSDAIDTALGRWDRAHLSLFELADATDICGPIEWENPPDGSVFAGATRLSRLNAGEQFLYTFDMGDDWTHLCIVAEQRIDPVEALGIIPDQPLAYWGWGEIPDQYGRRSESDDGEIPLPPDPQFADLPPLRPWWELHDQAGRGASIDARARFGGS